jgi:8-oxo-dGTP pyrophosphatase MutT (NUDIX family)
MEWLLQIASSAGHTTNWIQRRLAKMFTMPNDRGFRVTLQQVEAATAFDRDAKATSDFDLNADKPSASAKYRPAAVLVPLMQTPAGLRLILTKRAAHLKHHPGQVAFPGGKVDDGDANTIDAALREAHEEINLLPRQARVIGQLPLHKTVTGFDVHPIVAEVSNRFSPRCDPNEVEEVFSVPLEHVLDPNNYFIEGRVWMGHHRRYYVVPYGPYYIWGATARMLRMFADRIDQHHETQH